MVMGKVIHHYVEISIDKSKFSVKCSCHWSTSVPTRAEARAKAHFHIAEHSV